MSNKWASECYLLQVDFRTFIYNQVLIWTYRNIFKKNDGAQNSSTVFLILYEHLRVKCLSCKPTPCPGVGWKKCMALFPISSDFQPPLLCIFLALFPSHAPNLPTHTQKSIVANPWSSCPMILVDSSQKKKKNFLKKKNV